MQATLTDVRHIGYQRPYEYRSFFEIGQTTAEIWRFFDFQDGSRRILDF